MIAVDQLFSKFVRKKVVFWRGNGNRDDSTSSSSWSESSSGSGSEILSPLGISTEGDGGNSSCMSICPAPLKRVLRQVSIFLTRQKRRRRGTRTSLLLGVSTVTFVILLVGLLTRYYDYSLPFVFGGGGRKIDAMSPRVELPQGIYVGKTLERSAHLPKRVDAWLGIAYGESTGGEGRFRPPVRVKGRKGRVVEAVGFGSICPAMGRVGGEFGEDCLNLNVYRAAREEESEKGEKGKRELLPVVVYVHGGGFNNGNGNERNMASFVAWAKEPMIGVSFNYRVGALGFLPSALTAREGLLNLGLRDQQMCLEWVRDNAEAFGGDPENITIMGLSAGAHSIGHHIMHYANSSTPPPFHKAILESGATTARAVLLPTHPRHLIQFREFLIATGLDGVPEEEVFSRLRKVPLDTIARASKFIWDLYEPSVTWPFQPVIDGPNSLANSSQPTNGHDAPEAIIPDLPIQSWRKGNHLRIPILTGYNANEGTVFIPSNANTNKDFRAFFKALIPGFNSTDLDKLEKLYPDPVTHIMGSYRSVPSDKGKQWARLDAAYSHYAYICPVLQTAHFLSNLSTAESDKLPVYVYRFAAKGSWGTANHGDEAPVVAHDVGFLERNGGMPGLTGVSEAMHSAWSQFVASKNGVTGVATKEETGGAGDVFGSGGLEWPEFQSPFTRGEARQKSKRWLWGVGENGLPEGTGRVMVFGEGNDERMGGEGKMKQGVAAQVMTLTKLEVEACRFWWSRIELSQGLGRRDGEEAGEERVRAKL